MHPLLLTCCVSLLAVACGCGSDAPGRDAPAPAHAGAPPAVDTPAQPGLTRDEQQRTPPGPPGNVDVERRDGVSTVRWSGTRDDTIRGYVVYRRCDGAQWTEAAFVALHADDERNRGAYAFEDRRDAPCEYAVAATDAHGPGPKSTDIH